MNGYDEGNFVFSDNTKAILIKYIGNDSNVIILNSVTSIGDSAFVYCSDLTSVNIPDSVTSIGDDAFKNVPHIYYNGPATGSPWGAKAIN